MKYLIYFTILHDATRVTNGHIYKLPDTRLKVGDTISLDEPEAKGQYIIIRITRKQAIGGRLFAHVLLRPK